MGNLISGVLSKDAETLGKEKKEVDKIRDELMAEYKYKGLERVKQRKNEVILQITQYLNEHSRKSIDGVTLMQIISSGSAYNNKQYTYDELAAEFEVYKEFASKAVLFTPKYCPRLQEFLGMANLSKNTYDSYAKADDKKMVDLIQKIEDYFILTLYNFGVQYPASQGLVKFALQSVHGQVEAKEPDNVNHNFSVNVIEIQEKLKQWETIEIPEQIKIEEKKNGKK